jgi:hypothetical protein
MDMIYALLLADRQWGGPAAGRVNNTSGAVASDSFYLYWAKGGMAQFQRTCTNIAHPDTTNPLRNTVNGNWAQGANNRRITRPSDFFLTHWKSFADSGVSNTVRSQWNRTIETTNHAVNSGAHPTTGILPDFLWYGNDNLWRPLGPSPSDGVSHWNENTTNDRLYAWNACRVPWRLGLDILHNGSDSPINATVQRLNQSMHSRTSGNWSGIQGGQLDGTRSSSFSGSAFQAPYLVTAAAYGPVSWLTSGWDWARARSGFPDNYGDYIQVLSMIAASGNWWCPITPLTNMCEEHVPGPEATCGTPQRCVICSVIIAPATGNHVRSTENCTICIVCNVTGLPMNCGNNPCEAHKDGFVIYDMQLDAGALSGFNTVPGRAAHSLLTARNSPHPVLGSSPVSLTVPDTRGGTSQGIDIRIAPVGLVGSTDYGTGTLAARAGHTQYPSDRIYRFVITVRIIAGTHAERAMPPYDVWVRGAVGGTGDNAPANAFIDRSQTVQNNVDVVFDFELSGTEITELIAQGASVIRIGGASRNNLQVRGLVISERFASVETPVYNVTFDLDGGAQTCQTPLEQEVQQGSGATAPEVSREGGWIFDGWDKDYDKVTDNITVTAKWLRIGAIATGGDGDVTSLDLTWLARHIAGHTGFEIEDRRIANLRGEDRILGYNDVTMLARWLIGYDLAYLISQM